MKKSILIIVLILAAAGAAVWAFRGMPKTPDNRLLISGNIELDEVTIAFKTAGRLIERTVDEGDAVRKGQVIARLDRDQLLTQRERETAGLASSQSQLAQAQTAVELHRAILAADIETRRADLSSMEARLTAQSLDGAQTSRVVIGFSQSSARASQTGLARPPQQVECAFSRVLELRIALPSLGIPRGSGLRFQFSLWREGLPMDAVPQQGWLEMRTTDPSEMEG